MNVEQVCCVCFGVVVEAMTFALGVLVGASMRRKEPLSDKTTQSRAAGSDSA